MAPALSELQRCDSKRDIHNGYPLAIYALPFVLGLTAAQFAYQTGSGWIGAGLVGLFSVGVAFGILTVLFEAIDPLARHPLDRRACLRRSRHRGGLCAGPWHHQGGRAVRNLPANLLHRRRRMRRHSGMDATGGRRRPARQMIAPPCRAIAYSLY